MVQQELETSHWSSLQYIAKHCSFQTFNLYIKKTWNTLPERKIDSLRFQFSTFLKPFLRSYAHQRHKLLL